MIKLSKSPIPGVLSDNGAAWTKVLTDKIAAGLQPSSTELSRYRHPDIKAALVNETHGKCAYCESKLQHITYGDVEHIVPKSSAIEVTFEWKNLTLACDVCNTNKSNKFANGVGFIDPYVLDPHDHFVICGALIFGKPGDNDARLTEETLKLNRAALVEKRVEKLKYLRDQLEIVMRAPDQLRKVLLENLQVEIQTDQEFSAIAKAFLNPWINSVAASLL